MKRLSVLLAFAPVTAFAAPPTVVTDILPVEGLVAAVMGDLAAPLAILPPNASPHDYALRPSDARNLQDAALIVHLGEGLSPGFSRAIANIGADAEALNLMTVEGTLHLEMREDFVFGLEDTTHDHDHDHGHEAHDPHVWLSPDNGRLWTTAIADALAALDPDNAKTYRQNAETAIAAITTAESRIADALSADPPAPAVVFHDAYQYFEVAFDIPAAGAISVGDATDPGPARIA
ncbi:MAG: zinc ABC transporter solute-binding protein, partial [Rhodobacteraceae bacterium]|nr:zinc ABC transporter solute-binding protein [Paracoccaceae bacterium]